MKNSGFVSVGHLLNSKTPDEYKLTFQHFGTILQSNVGENTVYKLDGRWRFDQFFKSLKPTVESYAKFLCGILRCHATDSREFSLTVERIVWDLIKFNYDDYTNKSVDRTIIFKLFSIFNRFCVFEQIPMILEGTAVPFVFHKLGISAPLDYSLTFEQFVENVIGRRDTFVLASIGGVFDEFVRDVIIEDRVLIKVESVRSSFSFSPAILRMVSVTSSHLIIQEDISSSPGTNCANEERNVLEKISIFGAKVSMGKSNGTIFRMGPKLQNSLTIVTPFKNIELTFDTKKDAQIVYKWTQALSEATESFKTNSDRLSKAKTIHGLDTGSDCCRGSVLKSNFNQSQSVLNGSTNVEDAELHGPSTLRKISFKPDGSAILGRVQSAPDLCLLPKKCLEKMHLGASYDTVLFDDNSFQPSFFFGEKEVNSSKMSKLQQETKPKRKTGHAPLSPTYFTKANLTNNLDLL